LKQLGLALLNYEQTNRTFPPPGFNSNQASWIVVLLPFLEQGALWEQFSFKQGLYTDNNKLLIAATPIEGLLCPSCAAEVDRRSVLPEVYPAGGPSVFTSHYYGVLGPNGTNTYKTPSVAYNCSNLTEAFGGYCNDGTFLYATGVKIAEILDGTSNTYLLGEISWPQAPYYRAYIRGYYYESPAATAPANRGTLLPLVRNVTYPINSRITTTWNNQAFGSLHPGGSQFAMADGSAKFVNQTIDWNVYLALASRNGSEAVAVP
jgi:prepilin-type processing-associated H-X9-DG protein